MMNYNIINKNINELLSQGIGIGIPFNNTTGINITYNTKDAIRSNLLNFLLTNQRERIFNPGIGSNVRSIIFENTNDNNIDDLKESIIYNINNYFPNVKINKLETISENNTLNLFLDYSIIKTNIQDNLQISLNNGN